jgi:hypothetical protein
MKKIAAVFAVIVFLFSLARAENTVPASFVHPGLFHTAAQLDFARRQIAAKAEPWSSTGVALQKFTDLSWTPHAKEDWDVYGTYSSNYLGADPVKAYAFAMQWAMSGDQRYADKAIEILNAWSSTLKTISNSRTDQQPQEAKVSCGWNGSHFANAAEILASYRPNGVGSGWSKEDQQRCRKMLLIFYDVIKDFEPGYNGNYDAAMMDTMACIAVFNNDQAMFYRAIDHFWGKYPYEETANHVDHGNLKVYFLADTGQCQETGRDQVHVQEALGNYAGLCAVAWNQGIDLYSAYDNLLLKGFEYTAKYNLGNDVPFQALHKVGWADAPDTGDPNKSDPIKHSRGLFLPVYVTAYQHYAVLKGMPMPFTAQVITPKSLRVQTLKGPNRPYLPEGMCENSGINWGTLNLTSDDVKAIATKPDDPASKNTTPKP